MHARHAALMLLGLVGCSAAADPQGPSVPAGPSGPTISTPAAATLGGRVLSKELGVMPGVRIMALPTKLSTTTGADGQWSMDALAPGHVTFRVTDLPSGCATPPDQPIDLLPGYSIRVRFLVDCSGRQTNPAT